MLPIPDKVLVPPSLVNVTGFPSSATFASIKLTFLYHVCVPDPALVYAMALPPLVVDNLNVSSVLLIT